MEPASKKTSFSPHFPDKTTSVAMSTPRENKPHLPQFIDRKNEVNEVVLIARHIATEVVLSLEMR